MITKHDAMFCKHFEHVAVTNADGSPARCRAMGKCKTWKTRPDDFRLPVAYGLRGYFYLTPENANDWNVA